MAFLSFPLQPAPKGSVPCSKTCRLSCTKELADLLEFLKAGAENLALPKPVLVQMLVPVLLLGPILVVTRDPNPNSFGLQPKTLPAPPVSRVCSLLFLCDSGALRRPERGQCFRLVAAPCTLVLVQKLQASGLKPKSRTKNLSGKNPISMFAGLALCPGEEIPPGRVSKSL